MSNQFQVNLNHWMIDMFSISKYDSIINYIKHTLLRGSIWYDGCNVMHDLIVTLTLL